MIKINNFYKIIIGDSKNMAEIKDETIHLHVNSPPYFDIKDYDHASQIGFSQNYEDYLSDLNDVWKECHRTLYKGCKLVIIVGDKFTSAKIYGKFKIIPIESDIIQSCNDIGFDLINKIIWKKITNSHPSGKGNIMGSYPYPRRGIVKQDFEYILIFEKEGKSPKVSKEIKEKSRISLLKWKEYFSGHWEIQGEKQDEHPAMFPLELPLRLIKMYSFIGEVVCDCFLGSGTTMLASKMLNRDCIGYELQKKYLPIIKKKVGFSQKIFNNMMNYRELLDKNSFKIIEKQIIV